MNRAFVVTYILALILLGLGHLAMLPPYEGFDETAHFASLREIADTGTLPSEGRSFMPQDVAAYSGPLPYSSLAPPFDAGLTYAKFFADPPSEESFIQAYRTAQPQPPYAPSLVENWEAQHPPLYYVLLATILKITGGFPFVTEMLILRMTSFLLAIGGVGLALTAVQAHNSQTPVASTMLGFALYPLMLPMFFPEFARLGNDSLCLLFVGASAFCLVRALRPDGNAKWFVTLGFCLALGLLTKALFVPVTLAVILFLAVRAWIGRNKQQPQIRGLILLLLPVLVLGGGWYLHHAIVVGEISGGTDAALLARQGGLWAGLQHNFSGSAMVRAVVTVIATRVWSGTWSFVHIAPLLQVPLMLLLIWTGWTYAMQLRVRRLDDLAWLPVFLLAFFGAGLFWHILVGIALTGGGITGGYYLHILMPWIAPSLGLGAAAIIRQQRQRIVLFALLTYAAAFQVVTLWSQFALFTGCARKSDDKLYEFTGSMFCLDQAPELVARLGVIAWPTLAAVCFAGGVLSALWLTRFLARERKVIG